jgi:phenylpropionate dioxygenase-like ring-hydroxylating dioxygenase large terminal subunit
LNAEGITLDEHLGRARRELDLFAGLSDDGEIGVTAGLQKYDYGCNWKLQIENALDGYHPNFVHSTFIDAVVSRRKNPATGYRIDYDPDAFASGGGVTRDLGGGHVMMDYGFRIYDTLSADAPPTVQATTESGARHLAELERQLGGAHAVDGLRAGATHTLIFPNLVLIGVHIRTVMPVSVDRTEVTLQPVTLRWLPDEVNAIRLRCHEAFYGSASFGAPDDIEIFERIADGLAASGADQSQWQPISRGINRMRRDDEGLPVSDIGDEMNQRAIWRQWKKVMTAGDHPKIAGGSVQKPRRRTVTRS